jgi:hypothetical protein
MLDRPCARWPQNLLRRIDIARLNEDVGRVERGRVEHPDIAFL